MLNPFFDHPILNSPYESPVKHWELDDAGQPTQKVIERRRDAKFVTPIPKPRKRKAAAAQSGFVFDEGKGLSTQKQQYDPTSIINEVRKTVDTWRLQCQSPNQWQVTPETARLLQHWRHHKFSEFRPFFCQVEAVETLIWLTEVAPQSNNGKRLLDLLVAANKDANPELMRLALKLATGAGKTTVMVMRIAAFEHVRRLSEVHDHLTAPELKPGFIFDGERIPLINPQRGIFKPHQIRFSSVHQDGVSEARLPHSSHCPRDGLCACIERAEEHDAVLIEVSDRIVCRECGGKADLRVHVPSPEPWRCRSWIHIESPVASV